MSSEPPLSAAREAAFSTALYEVYEASVHTSKRGPEHPGPPPKRRGPLPPRAFIFSPSPRFPAATPPRKECDEAQLRCRGTPEVLPLGDGWTVSPWSSDGSGRRPELRPPSRR